MILPRSLLSMTALTLLGTASILPASGAIEPTVIAERYYSSGRSERHQKTSPTLPYGAPIPDSYDTSSTTPGSTLAPVGSSTSGTTFGSTSTNSGTTGSGGTSGSTSTQSTTTGSTTSGTSIITPSSANTKDPGAGTDGAGSTKKGITNGRRGTHGTSSRLPEEIGRVEGPRDMNIFQLEPTIINERFYTSGQAERHQNISNTLPIGAPIPDRYSDSDLQSQNTVKPIGAPTVTPVVEVTKPVEAKPAVETKPGIEATPASDAKPSNDKP